MKGTGIKNLCHFVTIIIVIFHWSLKAQWVQTNLPVNGSVVLTFTVSGTNLFTGAQVGGPFLGGVFHSTDDGANWTEVNTGLTNTFIRALAVSGTNLFAGTEGSGVFRSTNNGTSWIAVNNGLTNTSVQALGVSGTNLFAGFLNSIFCSTNNGTTWTEVNNGLPQLPDIRTFAVSGINLFAGAGGAYPNGVFLSTNNGTSWTSVNNGLTETKIRALVVSGANLFAGTDGSGVFLSTNNGTNWTAVNTGLPTNVSGNALTVFDTNIFVGSASGFSASGVFFSTNNGTSWTAVSTGLTNKDVLALSVSGTYAVAGTFGSGVWRRPLSELITGIEDQSNKIPSQFILEQNYPNPFNPSTKISWQSPVSSHQTLKIYDLLGNEVGTLVDEYKPAGSYEVNWNASNLSSGVYFYKLKAGSFVQTRKMILIK